MDRYTLVGYVGLFVLSNILLLGVGHRPRADREEREGHWARVRNLQVAPPSPHAPALPTSPRLRRIRRRRGDAHRTPCTPSSAP